MILTNDSSMISVGMDPEDALVPDLLGGGVVPLPVLGTTTVG